MKEFTWIIFLLLGKMNFFYRSLIAVVGEKARDQVVLVHHMLSKASVKARPSGMYSS